MRDAPDDSLDLAIVGVLPLAVVVFLLVVVLPW